MVCFGFCLPVVYFSPAAWQGTARRGPFSRRRPSSYETFMFFMAFLLGTLRIFLPPRQAASLMARLHTLIRETPVRIHPMSTSKTAPHAAVRSEGHCHSVTIPATGAAWLSVWMLMALLRHAVCQLSSDAWIVTSCVRLWRWLLSLLQ